MRQTHNENEFAIAGDIKSMDVFEIAGIKRARCLVACSKDDIQNALIAITAKTANPHIKIIVRAENEENVVKLMRAGAHKVIVPGKTAGVDMGNEIVKRVFEKRDYKKT
jgi:voltage-gated potassium channel